MWNLLALESNFEFNSRKIKEQQNFFLGVLRCFSKIKYYIIKLKLIMRYLFALRSNFVVASSLVVTSKNTLNLY